MIEAALVVVLSHPGKLGVRYQLNAEPAMPYQYWPLAVSWHEQR